MPVQRSLPYGMEVNTSTEQIIDALINGGKILDSQDSGFDSVFANDSKDNTENKETYSPIQRPTISQDSMNYDHMINFSQNWGRTVVISLDKKSGDFVQLKVFKKLLPDNFHHRVQQVSLRRVEADKVFFQLEYFYEIAMRLMMRNNVAPLLNVSAHKDDCQKDLQTSHWNTDVHTSSGRIIRVSFTIYNIYAPLISTYFQVKVFKPDAQADGVFKREEYVSFTMQELKELKKMDLNPSKFTNF